MLMYFNSSSFNSAERYLAFPSFFIVSLSPNYGSHCLCDLDQCARKEVEDDIIRGCNISWLLRIAKRRWLSDIYDFNFVINDSYSFE